MKHLVKLSDEPLKSPRPGYITLSHNVEKTRSLGRRDSGPAAGTSVERRGQPAARIKPWSEAKIKQILVDQRKRSLKLARRSHHFN